MLRSEPLFTVIIPHRNLPHLLERCLDSIPCEEWIQTIVVDDGSDMDVFTGEQRTAVRRRQVELIENQHSNAGHARNLGLERAQGKWLLFADSDDFYTEEAWETLQQYAADTADLLIFKAESVDSDTLQPSGRAEHINLLVDECNRGHLDVRQAALATHVPWAKMVRRCFVERYFIRFDEVKASNDTMFATQCACLAEEIKFIPTAIYVNTTRGGSLWMSRMKDADNYLSRIEVYIRRNQYVKKFGFRQTPVLGLCLDARHISFSTMLRAFALVVRHGALLQGLENYFHRK